MAIDKIILWRSDYLMRLVLFAWLRIFNDEELLSQMRYETLGRTAGRTDFYYVEPARLTAWPNLILEILVKRRVVDQESLKS